MRAMSRMHGRSRKNRRRATTNRIDDEGIATRTISETLLDFAKPLLSLLPADLPPKAIEHQLKVPITIWNAIVVEELGDMLGILAQARALVAASGMPIMLALFDTLAERKRRQFGDEYRLIGRYRVRRLADGSLSIQAEARGRGRPVPRTPRSPG